VLFLCACSGAEPASNPPGDTLAPPPGEQVASELERDRSPGVDDATVAALTADNRAFAVDLYRELMATDGNLFVSPHSRQVSLYYSGRETFDDAVLDER
jgi:hypothetical protein